MLTEVAALPNGLRVSLGRCQTRDDVNCVRRLFAAVDDPKSQQLADWQYLEPAGGSFLAVAHDHLGPYGGGVAMCAAMPLPLQTGGHHSSAVQFFDILTLPPYRNRGLFTHLATLLSREMASAGQDLAFVVSNSLSTQGFKRHLGWTMSGPIPLRVRPVGFRYLWRLVGIRKDEARQMSVHESHSIASVPPDIDDLIDCDAPSTTGLVKSRDYLEWRLDRPGATYKTVEVRAPSGRLEAWGVACVTHKHGANIGYLLDVLFRPGSNRAGRQVVSSLNELTKNAGADFLMAWSVRSSPTAKLLCSRGYVPMPDRFRPIHLYFGYKNLGESSLTPSPIGGEWNISLLNSDTV